MTNTIKNKFNITWNHVRELLPPPAESKRTWALLDRESHLSSRIPPPLSALRGLATTIGIVTFSFFNSFYYTGQAIKACIIKVRHPKLAETLPTGIRSAQSSFLLFIASLLYLIYSIATLGIGPYFTNRKTLKFFLDKKAESKRTYTLLNREFHFVLRGLATTIRVATSSFFYGFYYTGQAIKALIKVCHLKLVETLFTNMRLALNSFLLFITSLLYLIYSIATLGIGPYFTNQKMLKVFSDKELNRLVLSELGHPQETTPDFLLYPII